MQIRLTQTAIQRIQEELATLENSRPEIAERIKSARGYGDLSENYEYHAAKEEQGLVEAKIRELRAVLNRAQVIEAESSESGQVGMGSKVTVMDKELGEEMQYIIVTMIDADPLNDRISEQSPIGQALVGKKVGDVVEIAVPRGKHHLEILKIEQADV